MLRRQTDGAGHIPGSVPPIVHEVLSRGGTPLNSTTRAYLEPRFGQDFSRVRVHTDVKAAESALAVDALAYTVGPDIVFADGRYAPGSSVGQRLLAHELVHVVQQGHRTGVPLPTSVGAVADSSEQEADAFAEAALRGDSPLHAAAAPAGTPLQRTPARQVSCGAASTLHVPAATPFDVDDPVQVITDAENGANALLDGAIDELDFTRQQIAGGASAGFPTVSDSLGSALALLALDANSDQFWKGRGLNTAELLLRRLRAVRGTIGAGSFFFTCLGPASGSIGPCTGAICTNADARSCGGTFRIVLCAGFWQRDSDEQASEILHESMHNFAHFIQDRGREGNAACYVRFVQTVAGVDPANQRTDLCPDP